MISNLPLKRSGLQILTSRVNSNVPTILPNVFPGFESVLFLGFIGVPVGATTRDCPYDCPSFHPHYFPLFCGCPVNCPRDIGLWGDFIRADTQVCPYIGYGDVFDDATKMVRHDNHFVAFFTGIFVFQPARGNFDSVFLFSEPYRIVRFCDKLLFQGQLA